MAKRTAWENNLNPHRVPNVAKYRCLASRTDTWARMVNSTKFDGPNGCWEWQSTINETGYGIYGHHEFGNLLAHRLALHVAGRPVPADMTVDHLCRNRRCVNPDHLEIVTREVNALRGGGYMAVNARKTHCVHGHPFDAQNTGYTKSRTRVGVARYCRTCSRERARTRPTKHTTE